MLLHKMLIYFIICFSVRVMINIFWPEFKNETMVKTAAK